MSLDTFEKETRTIIPGEHLFCVYGDNWFQSGKYRLQCTLAAKDSDQDVLKIMEAELEMADKKVHLEKFQSEFLEAKKKFEEACKVLEQDVKDIENLMKRRDSAYSSYLAKSASKYEGQQISAPENTNGGFLGNIAGKLFKKWFNFLKFWL